MLGRMSEGVGGAGDFWGFGVVWGFMYIGCWYGTR